jgi:hypothetical protein
MPSILLYGFGILGFLVVGALVDIYTRYRATPKEALVIRINYVLLFVSFNFSFAYWEYCDAKAARDELAQSQRDISAERLVLSQERDLVEARRAEAGQREKEVENAARDLESMRALLKECYERLPGSKNADGDGLTAGAYTVILENADEPNPAATELIMNWPLARGFSILKETPRRVHFQKLSALSAHAVAEKLKSSGGKVTLQGPPHAP